MNKKITKFSLGMLVMVLLVVVVIFLYKKPSPEKVSVVIGIQNNAASGLLLIAQEQGYFADENLSVELKKYPSGKLATEAMFNGEVDLSTASDVVVVDNYVVSKDIQVLASIAKIKNSAWIVARRDHDIYTVSDLKGKKIGTQENSAVHFFLDQFLVFNNLTKSDVEVVFLSPTDLPQALADGDIDAFSMREPYMTEAKENIGEDKLVEFFDEDVYLQYFNLLARTGYVNNEKETVLAVLRALSKADDFIHYQPKKSRYLIGQGFRVESYQDIKEKFVYDLNLEQALILNLEDISRWKIGNNDKTPNCLPVLVIDLLQGIKPENMTIIN